MTFSDNNITDQGVGEWVVTTYNPAQDNGPYKGVITRDKDFRSIWTPLTNGEKRLVAEFPNQNIAKIVNLSAIPSDRKSAK